MASIYIHLPHGEGETVTGNLNGGVPVTITNYAVVPETVEMQALAGRVAVLPGVLSAPSEGRAIARSDGQTTLDLRGITTATTITADLPGAQQAVIHVPAPVMQRGHPSGEHYWLPVSGNNHFVCEPGRRHRKWYIGRSAGCLTKAQIAAAAGVSEATVSAAWLLNNATGQQYGATQAKPIHADLFALIRTAVVADNTQSRSDHYLLERGQDYTGFDWGGFRGEDELHPMLIGAWGAGTDPVVKLSSNFLMLPFAVVQDVRIYRGKTNTWYGYCLAYDHVDVGWSAETSNTVAVTFYECTILTPWRDAPVEIVDGKWKAHGAHTCGIYTSLTEGILVDSCLIDHAGWADGYDYNGDATMPQPMSKYSHALYFSETVFDVTIRDNLLSRASSCGTQLRAGVHLEGNLLVDNNLGAAVNSFNGKGQFNNVIDNVIFSAGFRRVAYEEGAFDWGYDVNGPLSSMVGNVIAHGKNPDDPAETKAVNWYDGISTSAKLADDTQVWKWGAASRNVGGLAPAVLDQTTIQRFAGIKAGQASRTIAQFVTDTAAAPSIGAIVREGIRWTKSRFGSSIPQRATPADVIFRPDPRTEGFRWDNRLNWSTLDQPGTHVADLADLDGHFVRFGTVNAEIAALKSKGGRLDVTSGRLDIGGLSDAADMIVRMAGQVRLMGATQPLSVEAVSGRVALLGAVSDLDLYAGGHAQALLGPDCTVPAGRSLIISGQLARVGWDGTGTASLTIAGTLEFRRGIEITVNPGSTGRNRYVYKHIGKRVTGSVSGFTGRVAGLDPTTARGTAYRIWLEDVTGTPQVGDVFEVAPSRQELGVDASMTLTIAAVGTAGIAPLQRFRSGAVGNGLVEPTVAATTTLTATAQIIVPTGLPAGTYDLGGGTGTGVTYVNDGATLPAGVSLTGGKLVLVVS